MSGTTPGLLQAMLHRARTRMVEALLYEGGLAQPDQMHAYWRGFAGCAAALLNGTASIMANHDLSANEPKRRIEAALARFPADLERLTLVEMKSLLWAQGVEFASDLITDRDVDAVKQFVNGMRPIVKPDDEHAIARVDVGDGSGVHAASPVVTPIVSQGGVA